MLLVSEVGCGAATRVWIEPDGFQRAEYLHEHGIIDMVEKRGELAGTLARLIGLLTANQKEAA